MLCIWLTVAHHHITFQPMYVYDDIGEMSRPVTRASSRFEVSTYAILELRDFVHLARYDDGVEVACSGTKVLRNSLWAHSNVAC